MLGLPQTRGGTGLHSTVDDNSINGGVCSEFDGCGRSEGIGSGSVDKELYKDEREEEESMGWLKDTGKLIGLGTVWHCKIWFLILTTLLLHPPVW